MTTPLDPRLCPSCAQPNHCGLSEGKNECWCFSTHISESALERIPPAAKGVACICERCAQSFPLAEPPR